MSNDIYHKDFSTDERQTLADKGQAMPGGEYPIRNRADLKNAIQAYGRAKNKAAVKAWIIKRAKALGLTDLLPEGWLDMEQSSVEIGEEFLEHFGVKGMKWGVRKRRNESDRKKTFGKSGKPKPNPLKNMSDEELRAVVNRMNMEQQYTRLSSGNRSHNSAASKAMNVGAAFLGGIAVNIVRQQIQNQANARIAAALAARAARGG